MVSASAQILKNLELIRFSAFSERIDCRVVLLVNKTNKEIHFQPVSNISLTWTPVHGKQNANYCRDTWWHCDVHWKYMCLFWGYVLTELISLGNALIHFLAGVIISTLSLKLPLKKILNSFQPDVSLGETMNGKIARSPSEVLQSF